MAIAAILPALPPPEHQVGSHFHLPSLEDHDFSHAEGYHEGAVKGIYTLLLKPIAVGVKCRGEEGR